MIATNTIPTQEECNALAEELLKTNRRPSLLSVALDERIEEMIGCEMVQHPEIDALIRRKHVAIAYALWYGLIQ